MHLHQIEQPAEASTTNYVRSDSPINEDVVVVNTVQSEEHHLSGEQTWTQLTRETRKFKRTIVRVMAGSAILEASAIALKSVVPKAVWQGIQEWSIIPEHLFISATLSVGLLVSLAAVSDGRRPRRRRRALAAQVADSADKRSIGSLIDALQLNDAQTREIAVIALIDLLPQVTESDIGFVTTAQRAKLYKTLNTPVENVLHKDVRALFRPAPDRAVAFRIAILQALRWIGDEQALPIMRGLAALDPKTEGEVRIRDTARECIPILETRLEHLQKSQTLLRPSAVSRDSKNTLLRADLAEPEQDPQELLRAGQ